jgi:hypothetical protein
VLSIFNLLQWCFNRLIPAQTPHSGVNVSPRMAAPNQGFIEQSSITWRSTSDSVQEEALSRAQMTRFMRGSYEICYEV